MFFNREDGGAPDYGGAVDMLVLRRDGDVRDKRCIHFFRQDKRKHRNGRLQRRYLEMKRLCDDRARVSKHVLDSLHGRRKIEWFHTDKVARQEVWDATPSTSYKYIKSRKQSPSDRSEFDDT